MEQLRRPHERDVMASGKKPTISARMQLDLRAVTCTCAFVYISNRVSPQVPFLPVWPSSLRQCLNATLCFHSYLASWGSLRALCWFAASPVLRAQGSRHFPIFKPTAFTEHMSNNWMTHVTSAEAERSSEELKLDSRLVSERPKHNTQENNDKHLGGGGCGSML